MNRAHTRWLLLLLTLSVGLTACSKEEATHISSATVKKTVQIATVHEQEITSSLTLPGTLEPLNEVVASSELSGVVVQTSFEVGDKVKKGAVLAKLDTDALKLQLEEANQGVKQAKAGINSASAGIKAALAQVKSAEAQLQQVKNGARKQERDRIQNSFQLAQAAFDKAKLDAERTNTLFEKGIVSKTELESVELALQNADKDVKDAESTLSEVNEGAIKEQINAYAAAFEEANSGKLNSEAVMDQASAVYKLAVATKKQAELALTKSTLVAVQDGVIINKAIKKGELIAAGQALFSIADTHQLKILVPIPDRVAKEWRKGMKVEVSLYNEVVIGEISNIYPVTNAGTGTVNGEIHVTNKGEKWIPGQVVKVHLKQAIQNVMMVPVEAVINDGDTPYLFVITDGKAVKTNVTLGESLADNQFEIKQGLKKGQQVVIKGADTLLDGDMIQPVQGTQR